MMPREQTIPHRLLSALGWIYALGGRERCDICGGPLPSGELRRITRDVPLQSVNAEVEISLCENCDNAYWVRETPDVKEPADWHRDLLREIPSIEQEPDS